VAYFPILDDIQEFTIQSNNVAAEFGRFNGGVVNVATRSGSNALHGSLFEYFRNEDLNARNYFSAAPTRKPEYRRNLYGATLGAPIIHDKLFFFGDYQGVKQLIGKTVISTIPTLAMRQGIFTGVSKIFNPTTTQTVGGQFVRKEFPNDVINIPFDSAAQSLLARYPTPTTSAAANNYSRTGNDSTINQFDVRVDGVFGHAIVRSGDIPTITKWNCRSPSSGWQRTTGDGVLGSGNVRIIECAGAAGGIQRDAYIRCANAEYFRPGPTRARGNGG
jgi:hypothetical protein